MTHHYYSTACLHDIHDQCRMTCKFCEEKCECLCHVMSGAIKIKSRPDADS